MLFDDLEPGLDCPGQCIKVRSELADDREMPAVLAQGGGNVIVSRDDPAVPRLAPVNGVLGAKLAEDRIGIFEQVR